MVRFEMKRFMGALLVSLPFALACGPRPTATGTGGGGGQGGTGGSPSGNLPCDVAAVLKEKCQNCHASTPQFGAPMPLMTYADTQGMRGGQQIWRAMQSAVATGRMPQGTTLSQAQKDTLTNWFNRGAPAGTPGEVCQGGGPDGGDFQIGPDKLPCPVTVRFLTYGGVQEGSGQKYSVGTGQRYVTFRFANPFAPGGAHAGELVTAEAHQIDNSRVIHHYILFGQGGGSVGTHVAGWAPGGTNTVLDPDIGKDLSSYTGFSMQVHYSNSTGGTQTDQSGVAFCTTREPRTYKAGTYTVGSFNIRVPPLGESTTVGSCTARVPMTVIETAPHMHQTGTGFTTEHLAGGIVPQPPLLSNIPKGTWSFDGQKHYPIRPRRQVAAGDVIRTTCYYKNPTATTVTFGQNTEDEMCFDFMVVYPYGPDTHGCGLGF
jgi:hypothetical protein